MPILKWVGICLFGINGYRLEGPSMCHERTSKPYLCGMKIKISELKILIKEIYAGSDPMENYNHDLLDDPSFNTDSVYVPKDIKDQIKSWMKKMKLTKKSN